MGKFKYSKENDRPIDSCKDDRFQMSNVVQGLTDFIKTCETPMTISIQGEWGCGKTSTMNMVREELMVSGINTIWFNTWQFSQLNLDEQLSLTFLLHLTMSLVELLPEQQKSKDEVGKKITSAVKTLLPLVLKHFVSEELGEFSKEALDCPIDEESIIKQIDTLKANFQTLVNKVLEQKKRVLGNAIVDEVEDRIVIFIDDIDRIQPARAIDLLETLKVFTDCDKCVFVLAVDTDVVFQGIRLKYGQDLSEEKEKNFFDKIIQVPFKIPMNHYDLTPMLNNIIPYCVNDDYGDDTRFNRTIKLQYLLYRIVNGNPRTLKRLNNIYLLELALHKDELTFLADRPVKEEFILILVGIQLRFPTVYSFIVNNPTYEHLQDILSLNTSAESCIKSGETLYKEFVSLGMPDCVITDKELFFDIISALQDVMLFYIELLGGTHDDELTYLFAFSSFKTIMGSSTPKELLNTSDKCTQLIKEVLRQNNIKTYDKCVEYVREQISKSRNISDSELRCEIERVVSALKHYLTTVISKSKSVFDFDNSSDEEKVNYMLKEIGRSDLSYKSVEHHLRPEVFASESKLRKFLQNMTEIM